ncbi:inositol monophosphatase family protein [Trichlorobacter lovleyi]|uniref:Inositol-1-monophosphatase n=1 Tax=Trichlorobacter lovleyi (strain ATCC BAA-1151 / DSM 17278 / SZ) TaxID=398767 RepID=B3E1Q2_TRIL1|nr:inositol monophosphatase family protein [Trichlorobacter lovleyi]ACD94144.1 Inositol-phosphate phosphatase [Trichlorobacter lovleyi SZ]
MPASRFLDCAIEAALAAGQLQRSRFDAAFSIDLKGAKNLVTELDLASEALIVEKIHARFPEHGILAEEGDYPAGDGRHVWIIDPLDGTTNYAHGYPWFCVSIALAVGGELVVGAIYNPMTDELFSATTGGGAFRNGRRLSVSNRQPLASALLGTGFPYDCATDPENNFDHFIRFQKAARGIRRAGAAALDLAYLAAGRLDGFWEVKLKPWDVAAGTLLVREAGGLVSAFDGSDYEVTDHRILASNGLIHDEMIALLAAEEEQP